MAAAAPAEPGPEAAESVRIVQRRYRFEQPGGGVVERVVLVCPLCTEEFEDFPPLCDHAWAEHGLSLDGRTGDADDPRAAADEADEEASPAGPQVTVTRTFLPDGSFLITCPTCGEQVLGEEGFLEHMAAKHGRALAAPGGAVGGTSESLDHLHQASEAHWHPEREEALRRLRVVSLGSFCGVKFAIQRLGLGDAHLPFDWIRSTLAGVRHFVSTGFQDYFCVATQQEVPGTSLRVLRSERHSFWHDDVTRAEARAKLKRRIERFLALGDDADGRDLLFVRSCATTEELQELPSLHAALASRFASDAPSAGRRRRRVLLAAILDGQESFAGPLALPSCPGVAVVLQPLPPPEAAQDGAAYCRAVSAVVSAALALDGAGASGGAFAVGQGGDGAEADVTASPAGPEALPRVVFCDAGCSSGYEGVACFELPGAKHVNVDV
eukprot:TRINITY_DN22722_c0_g1_i1.p1 TRINITY_DN22722_c0_g1~~TRINITY_DN22722_c0_g1_i1.p1  ORF type:complete len:456 (+),score=120.00 TRINITY_DN22722_c0_g1_i1:53-1369(+)